MYVQSEVVFTSSLERYWKETGKLKPGCLVEFDILSDVDTDCKLKACSSLLRCTGNCTQQCQYFYLVNDRLYTEHRFGTNQLNSELVFDINCLLILHVLVGLRFMWSE